MYYQIESNGFIYSMFQAQVGAQHVYVVGYMDGWWTWINQLTIYIDQAQIARYLITIT